MFITKALSIFRLFVLILLALTFIFLVGLYNGTKYRNDKPVEYVDYINVCSWKKDIIGCIDYLKDAENKPFNFERE